jgi:hypothetical protein
MAIIGQKDEVLMKLFLVAFLLAGEVVFSQPFSGTIFDFPESFRDSDPSALTSVTSIGRQQKSVYDRRTNGYGTINGYAFTAAFNDNCPSWTLLVNPEFTQAKAESLAQAYARNIGQMPHCIRSGLTGAVIHDGVNPWGGGNPLIIHHGQGLEYADQGIVTETMIHEATHAAFDPKYYTTDWSAAVTADGQFISTYAKDNPTREDHSESFLCWIVARYKKDRVSNSNLTKITTAIPNRLAWYDAKNFNLSPIPTGTFIRVNRAYSPKRNASRKLNSTWKQSPLGPTQANGKRRKS